MKQVAAALVKAQKEFGPALKTATNPHFRTLYANLSACVEAVIDALNNNGIALVQHTHECADGVIVETIFYHESGEALSCGKLHVPAAKQDPQGYGSALTYARRYSLMAACGIAPEDDDANAATKSAPAKPVAKAEPKPKEEVKAAPPKMVGKEGQFQLKVSATPDASIDDWAEVVRDAASFALGTTGSVEDVMAIFRTNRVIFDRLQADKPESYKEIMALFAAAKKKFIKEEPNGE